MGTPDKESLSREVKEEGLVGTYWQQAVYHMFAQPLGMLH